MDRVVRPLGRTKIKDLLILPDEAMDSSSSSSGEGFRGGAAMMSSGTGAQAYRIVTTTAGGQTELAGGASAPIQAVLTSPLNGQFYVIGNPSDVLGSVSARSLAPRMTSSSSCSSFTLEALSSQGQPKDERRRATHNEVERRRRDNINTWIMKLSKLLPYDLASSPPRGESGQAKTSRSKGDILAKACEYVAELRNTNQRLLEKVDHRDQIVLENERLQQQIETLKTENIVLRQTLQSNGIVPPGSDRISSDDIIGLDKC